MEKYNEFNLFLARLNGKIYELLKKEYEYNIKNFEGNMKCNSYIKNSVDSFNYKFRDFYNYDTTGKKYENPPLMILNKKELISEVCNFYSLLDEPISEIFNKLVVDPKFIQYGFNDLCTINYKTKTALVECSYSGKLKTYGTLVHECAHAVEYNFDSSERSRENKESYLEFAPIFLEIVSFWEAKNSICDENDSLRCIDELYKEIKYASDTLGRYKELYYLYYYSSSGSIENLFVNAVKAGFDIDEIKKLVKVDFNALYQYVASSYYALELFSLYLSDKDKAFDILIKFMKKDNLGKLGIGEFFKYEKVMPNRNTDKLLELVVPSVRTKL